MNRAILTRLMKKIKIRKGFHRFNKIFKNNQKKFYMLNPKMINLIKIRFKNRVIVI